MFPATYARAMVEQFATRLVEIPDARSLVHEGRPDEVGRAVLEFLAGAAPAP